MVEEVMRDWSEGLGERRWVLNEEALRATWWQQQDEWTQKVYDTYAFVLCVLRLYEDAVDFLDVWWSAALGNFNWEVPGPPTLRRSNAVRSYGRCSTIRRRLD